MNDRGVNDRSVNDRSVDDRGVSLRDAVRAAAARLAAAGVETPDLDARVLAAEAFGLPVARLLTGTETADGRARATLARFIERRRGGEPVARILGRREFWGLDFELAPETLAPRPDTETLVEATLAVAPRDRPIRILDLGTGSGCILLALLSELPNASGVGVDLAPGAATAARRNAAALGLGPRAAFVVGRWADALAARFDIVVSNPPYIESADIAALEPEVRLHDPALALDGGPDGLDAYRAIAEDLPRRLRSGGFAALELGAGQYPAVASIASASGCEVVATHADLAGVVRALVLRWSGRR